MLRRGLAALVTATVASALVLPVAAGTPAAVPAGSLASWRQGQWWIEASKLRSWHDQGVTGKGVTIALVDGPVFTGVAELVGQDVRPSATLCDREPWRSWGPTTPTGPLNDTSFHTTSMAALLVGSGRGNGAHGVGVLGVAPGATVKTYAVFNTKDPAAHQNLDCWGQGYADLIDTIVADGASVIDIPVGIDVSDDAVQAAYNRAFSRGVVIVASSGNGGRQSAVMSPGGNRGVLVVGGIQADGQVADTNPTSRLAGWHQAQTIDEPGNIHLVAPGADIVGGGLTAANQWDSAVLQNGSSAASAIVAGQLALLRQKWPSATGNQLLYSVLRSARRPAGGPVWEPRRGFGTTSFETTLTTDPTSYPDVNPIFHTMAAVFDDHPTAAFMPLRVGGDGLLPRPPAGSAGSGSGPATVTPAAEPGPLAVSGVAVATTSERAWLLWLVGGLLAVAALFGAGWLVTRIRWVGAPAVGGPHGRVLGSPVSGPRPKVGTMSQTTPESNEPNGSNEPLTATDPQTQPAPEPPTDDDPTQVDPTQPSDAPAPAEPADVAAASAASQGAQQPSLPGVESGGPRSGGSGSGGPGSAGSGSGGSGSGEMLGAGEPGEASTTVKEPGEWVTGNEPMTGAQRSYLDTLARQAGEQLPADLTKAQASEHIDRLQAKTGRGAS